MSSQVNLLVKLFKNPSIMLLGVFLVIIRLVIVTIFIAIPVLNANGVNPDSDLLGPRS